MPRIWIAVSGVLALASGLLGWQLYRSIAHFNAENDLSRFQPAKDLRQTISPDAGLAPLRPRRHYEPAEFAVIAAQNPFSESRTNQLETEAPVAQEAPRLQVRPILVGVTLAGNRRWASIIDPSSGQAPAAGGRRAQTKRVGDVYQGYTIVDITENQMVLASGDQREVIPLFDSTKQRTPGGKTAIVATRVVDFAASGASGAAARVMTVQAGPAGIVNPAPSGLPSAPSVVTTDRPGPSQPAAAGAQQAIPARSAIQAGRSQVQAASPQTQPGSTWNERVDDQGRRIIRTPFGDIIRDKPPNN